MFFIITINLTMPEYNFKYLLFFKNLIQVYNIFWSYPLPTTSLQFSWSPPSSSFLLQISPPPTGSCPYARGCVNRSHKQWTLEVGKRRESYFYHFNSFFCCCCCCGKIWQWKCKPTVKSQSFKMVTWIAVIYWDAHTVFFFICKSL